MLPGLDADAPPEGLSRPLSALWWVAKGDFATGPAWEKAHALCQMDEGEPAHDLAHAVVHLVEGDLGNADYWFRRAGRRRASADARAEWQAAVDALAR